MIDSFRNENRFLSNFYKAQVFYEWMPYPSVENAYVAAKTLNVYDRIFIATLSASDAKKEGKNLVLRNNWNQMRRSIMEYLVKQKFSKAHPELQEKLLATGSQELIESNTWNDTYWGVCNGKGTNYLGKILMRVRNEIKQGNLSSV